MIKTNTEGSWEYKVNFIDKNDVFVGYDTAQDCCEDAGYAFLEKPEAYSNFKTEDADLDLDSYVFDVNYFETIDSLGLDDQDEYYSALDAGGQVFFKLISESKPDMYLTLYNAHNGYYGHGFETNVKGVDFSTL